MAFFKKSMAGLRQLNGYLETRDMNRLYTRGQIELVQGYHRNKKETTREYVLNFTVPCNLW